MVHMWAVYILKCSDNSLYTGISNNVEQRIATHNDARGAKYTRARLPVALVYCENVANRSEATKREMAIKSLTRVQKLKLIEVNQ